MSGDEKKLTAEEGADFVVDTVWELRKRTIGDWTKAIAAQIKSAETAAREEGFKTGEIQAIGVNVPVAASMAYEEGIRTERATNSGVTKFVLGRMEGFREGQESMRERMAKSIALNPDLHDLAEEIRALPLLPSEPKL